MAKALVALAGIGLAVAACGGGSDGTESVEARDPLRRGPQGNVAQFVVECELSHLAYDDPIVHPGMAGMSHLHQFFGNADVTSDPDYDRVSGADTSCERSSDTASYWAPALLDPMGEVDRAHQADRLLPSGTRRRSGIGRAVPRRAHDGRRRRLRHTSSNPSRSWRGVAAPARGASRRRRTVGSELDDADGAGVEPATAQESADVGHVPGLLGRRDLVDRDRLVARRRQRRRSLSVVAPGADPAAADGDRLPGRRPGRSVARFRWDRDRPCRLLERLGSGDPRAGGPALPESRPRLRSEQRPRHLTADGLPGRGREDRVSEAAGVDDALQERLRARLRGDPKICDGGPSSRIRPWCRKHTRSLISRANAISWVANSIVMPSALRPRTTSSTSPTSSGSSAEVISSSSITSGFIASDRAIATRCCWPPDSWSG